MKDFNARTEGINNLVMDPMQFTESEGAVYVPGLKPGVMLILNESGMVELLGRTDVDLSNKHLVYYCNSWKDAMSALGNSVVSGIPVTKQFDYDITFDANDDLLDPSADLNPGDLLSFKGGVFTAAGAGDYVIGSVKSGSASGDLGGTINVATWGGDYVIPQN